MNAPSSVAFSSSAPLIFNTAEKWSMGRGENQLECFFSLTHLLACVPRL